MTIRFDGQWNGLNRDLSLRHFTAQGRRTKLEVEDGPITDANGQPLVVEFSHIDGGWTRRYHIYVRGAADADRTIIIHYRVRNAIRFVMEDLSGQQRPTAEIRTEAGRVYKIDEIAKFYHSPEFKKS